MQDAWKLMSEANGEPMAAPGKPAELASAAAFVCER